MDQNSYRPWNILLHKKRHATSVRETFHVNRLPFRVYSLAFRAKRVRRFIRLHLKLSKSIIFFSKWRPRFTCLQMICNWQYTYVCIVMKINLENDRPIFLSSLYSVSTKDKVFNGVCFESLSTALSCRCNIKMHNTSKCFFTVYKMWLPKKKSKSTLGRSSLMLKIITVSGVSYWNFIIFVMLQHK